MNTVIAVAVGVVLAATAVVVGVKASEPHVPTSTSPGSVVSYANE